MVKFRDEDLQKLKEEDPKKYYEIMDILSKQEERRKKNEELNNKFWDMIEELEKKSNS